MFMNPKVMFIPENKYLLVEKVETKTENLILRPENQKDREKISIVRLIQTEMSSLFNIRCGQLMAILSTMIEEIQYKDKKFLLVPESAVFGFIFDEREIKESEDEEESSSSEGGMIR